MTIRQDRLFRPMPPEFFRNPEVVAVHDQKENIVHFNTRYAGDTSLTNRALFMDRDGNKPVMLLPEGYLVG